MSQRMTLTPTTKRAASPRRDPVADRAAVEAAMAAVETEGITQKEAFERAGIPIQVFYGQKREIMAERGLTSAKKKPKQRQVHVRSSRKTSKKKLKTRNFFKDVTVEEPSALGGSEQLLRSLTDHYKTQLKEEALNLAQTELDQELTSGTLN